MKKLELLLEQECSDRLEGFLVFYSCSTASLKPKEMPIDSITAYADSLNKQFGVPSPSTRPRAPSSLPTAKTFDPVGVIESYNKPYETSISEEELAYANNLNKQFSVPSPTLKPVTSHAPNPRTFDYKPVLEAVKNPACPSLSNTIIIPSSPVKQANASVYNAPKFEILKPAPELEPLKTTINLRPEKKYYDDFKMKHNVRTSGLKDKSPVYDLFKKNEFPRIYDQVAKGLKLSKYAVRTITFTNPLKNKDDYSPSFRPWNRNLRLPAIKPKTIPFDFISQKKYNRILNNAFLPHELGHAKVEEKYRKYYPDIDVNNSALTGFQEHLVDIMSLDSVKNTSQSFKTRTERIKFENTWVTPSNHSPLSRAESNYYWFLNSKKEASFIPGKQATINMLGEPLLKQNYDTTLRNVLDLKYGNDTHKETVYNNINKLSNLYQTQAIKLVNLSKRNNIFSDFKAKKILSDIEKKTFRFVEGL